MTVTLVDGTRVVVPDSLDLFTPYVLLEQQDWFEDEIKFLRRLLQPAMKVVDIGANYGVYTLSMATAVGPAGYVWAFEPASGTANLLEQGVAANKFGHVTVERIALSSTTGSARLSLNDHSELNALVRGVPATGASETVIVSTLDERLEAHGWTGIDFVKIDAEGEEARILKGGARFFAGQCPLVQYEIKVGNALHMDLVQAFAAMGYDSYRLVPGLDLLVPFDATSPDPFLLNLFCCKPDCAAKLAAAGFLVRPAELGAREESLARIKKKTQGAGRWNWRKVLMRLPYAAALAGRWAAAGRSTGAEEALACHALSRDPSAPAAERFFALEASLQQLKRLCESGGPQVVVNLASMARVAKEFGARGIAVAALNHLCKLLTQHRPAGLASPFLAPAARFDSIPRGDAPENWLLAAALEEFERLATYSSFYTGSAARERLEKIRDLGFGSPEMKRRLDLLQKRVKPLQQ